MKEQSNHWRKPLDKKQAEHLRENYDHLLKVSRGGLLTTNQRKRLLGLKKATQGEDEKKLWFDIRESVSTTFLDLRLICDIASDNQLKVMFEPVSEKDLPLDKNSRYDQYAKYTRNDVTLFVNHLLFAKDRLDWKFLLASKIMLESVYYLGTHPKFDTELHRRLFGDLIDLTKSI